MRKCILPVIMVLILLSCSDMPTRDNPYDLYFDMPEPTDLLVENISITTNRFSWNYDLDRFDGFIISRQVDNGSWAVIDTVAMDEKTFTDYDAPVNVNIRYKIVAYADQNFSEEVLSDYIDNTIPTPTDLTYERLDIDIIKLLWNDNSEGEEGFWIDKKVGTEEWIEGYATIDADGTNWIDENAEFNEEISYRIKAFYGEFESNTVETEAIDTTLPAPENLDLVIVNAEANLTWEYELAGIEGFRIEKKAYEGDWQLYADNIVADLREWEDENCNYFDIYRIKAFYHGDESDCSDEVCYFEEIEGMVGVIGGSYEMGDHFNEGADDELPVHTVTLNSFYIGQYEVTQGEYEAVMGSNPAHNYGVGDNYPVYYVTWYDAVEYCNALSIQEDLTPCYDTSDWSCDFGANGYRLPTEAEWEYAARGGIIWEDNYRYSGCHEESDLPDYAWYDEWPNGTTHEVGTKLPNQLDIYDISGNVWEWCNDRYDSDYYESSPVSNPTGPGSGFNRVLHGGSWSSYASGCRSANRGSNSPDYVGSMGFRLARTFP